LQSYIVKGGNYISCTIFGVFCVLDSFNRMTGMTKHNSQMNRCKNVFFNVVMNWREFIDLLITLFLQFVVFCSIYWISVYTTSIPCKCHRITVVQIIYFDPIALSGQHVCLSTQCTCMHAHVHCSHLHTHTHQQAVTPQVNAETWLKNSTSTYKFNLHNQHQPTKTSILQ